MVLDRSTAIAALQCAAIAVQKKSHTSLCRFRDQEESYIPGSRRRFQGSRIKNIHTSWCRFQDQEDQLVPGSGRSMNSGIRKIHEQMQESGISMNAGIRKIHEHRDQEDPWMQGSGRSMNAGIRKTHEWCCICSTSMLNAGIKKMNTGIRKIHESTDI